LMKASHKNHWVSVSTGRAVTEVELQPGQFIFGRDSAARELGMVPSTIWKRMQKLKKLQNVDIQSSTHYSIVSIMNWDAYQAEIKKGDSESDRQVTGKEQPSDTNKNVKNDKKYTYKLKVPFPSGMELTDDMVAYAVKKGCKNNGHIRDAFEYFVDYHKAKGSKFKDWVSAWQTWVRNDAKFHPEHYQEKIYD